MSVIPKGQEPERIKKRMDILFAKLDEAYPDKVIIYLQRDHKKWSETIRELYRLLGYKDNKSFLEAYGYIYERANGGRSNAFAPNELINALKEKYQDSPKRKSIGELMLDNPEIKGNLKTLQNKAPELFGMSLAKYLKDLGILSAPKPKEAPKTQRVKKKKLYHYLVVSVEGFKDNIICATDVRTATEGSVVEICKINSDEKYRGNVIETHYFNEEENLPMPIDEMYQCIRRITNAELKEIEASKIKYIFCSVQIKGRDDTLYYISPFEDVDIGDIVEVPHNWYGTVLGTIANIEHVSEKTAPYPVKRTKKIEKIVMHTKELSEINNSVNTLCNQFGTEEFCYIPVDKNVIELYEKMTYFSSAVFRGIDIDVYNALISLYPDELNPLTHRMKLENGFSQFECTSSEVPRIIKEFPNLKCLSFAEDWKNGNVYLAYSESGYDSVTQIRLTGTCEFYCRDRWPLVHDPSDETFEESDIKYSFDEKEKWEKCDYVLPDGNRRLAKATPLYSKPYPKAKMGDACEVIEICYPKNEEQYLA